MDFLIWTVFVITKITQPSPIPQADIHFIDDSSNGIGGIHGPNIHQSINTSFSPQASIWLSTTELVILIHLLWLIHKPLKSISDSAYVVGLFPAIGLHAHSNLPGFIQKEISRLIY